MTGLTFTLRETTRLPLDLGCLLPERLAGQSERALAALPLRLGNRTLPLGELLTIHHPGDAGTVVIEGTGAGCDRLGAGMTAGRLIVDGDAGRLLGVGMKGGSIEVRGSAGPLAAAEAAGGVVRIEGDAGPRLGGSLPGAGGLSGAAVLVGGSCGELAGQRMRKGLIVVGGDAGPHPAMGMRGGTVVLRGACGPDPAPLMARGTLWLAREPARLLPTFAEDGHHDLLWLRLLERYLGSLGLADVLPGRRVRRLAGDLAGQGKGEILLAT
jgi:formylmethanofuran dehydrogenase subunit C